MSIYPSKMCSNKVKEDFTLQMNNNIISYTLIFVKNQSKLLLGLKKRGLGVNKWNGFGGKLNKNENLFDCAHRELYEECSLTAKNLKHIGVLFYEVVHRARIDLVHVFTTNEYSGTLTESEEMKPQWYDMNNIPYGNMWPDARLWHQFMFDNKFFLAHVVYKDEETVKSANISEYDSLSSVLKSVNKLQSDLKCDNTIS